MGKRPRLGELLVKAGAIDQAQLSAALGEQGRWGRPLGMTLVQMGFLDEETLVRTLARQLKLPVAWLRGKRVKPHVLEMVPAELATKYRCMPLLVNEAGGSRVLFLAMQDPADLDALDEITFRVGFKVKPVLVAPGELDEALAEHYESGDPLDSAAQFGPPAAEVQGAEPDLLVLEHEVGRAPDAQQADAAGGPRRSGPIAHDTVVRALSQLLVEKGVLTRDELVERLESLALGESSDPF